MTPKYREVAEEEGDKEDYMKFFAGKMKKYGVKSPSELSDEDKKKFFDEIDKGWKGDNEKPEPEDEETSLGNRVKARMEAEDEKEDELISVWTDKELYTPGDIVHITGRSNSIHVDTFDIHIEQTGVQNAFTANEAAIRADPINILQTVRLDGESKFGLSFKIPSVDESLGTYKITAGANFGKGYGYFKVVKNPETYVIAELTPLGLRTDKPSYALNDKLEIFGLINKYELTEADSITFQQVQITFKDPVGHTLKHSVHTSSSTDKYEEQLFLFTSIPDQVAVSYTHLTLPTNREV